MEPKLGEIMALIVIIAFTLRALIGRLRQGRDNSLLGTRPTDLLRVPEKLSFKEPRRIISAVTARQVQDIETPSTVPTTLTQVQNQPIEEKEEEVEEVQEEVSYDYKTCSVFSESDKPFLELGSISDLSVAEDGTIYAIAQATEKGLNFKPGPQDVLVARNDVVEEEFDSGQPFEDQYNNVNRVRVWSGGVIVFDETIGDFDPSGFDTTQVEGLAEDGKAILIVLGAQARVLFQEI